MNTIGKILLVSSLCFVAYSSPMRGNPVSVTVEKQGTVVQHEVSQQDQNAFISTQVRVALRNIPGFVEDKVMIKADKGVVTLSGTVADENTKASLEKSAQSVPGVTFVKNDIKVENK